MGGNYWGAFVKPIAVSQQNKLLSFALCKAPGICLRHRTLGEKNGDFHL